MANMNINNFAEGIIKLFDYINKNPFLKILESVIKFAIIVTIFLSIVRYKEVIRWVHSTVNDIEIVEHNKLMEHRLSIDSDIAHLLTELCKETGADASFIFEFHNGTNNLSGMPFFYMDMTYEHVACDDKPLYGVNAWKNIPVSGYPFIGNYYERGFYIGDVEDISKIDKSFAYKLLSQGTNKIGSMIMYGKKQPIGLIGISSGDTFNISDADIERILIKYCQKIAIKLDAEEVRDIQ